MRKNSIKNRRINDEVQRALSEIVRGSIKDPRISPLISIVAVEVAPDRKTCKVWFSVYGDEEAGRETLKGLQSASGFIRSELARTVNLRNTPELTFYNDHSIAYGTYMSHRIDEVNEMDEAARKARGESDDPEQGAPEEMPETADPEGEVRDE